jgi:hypothetical protein
MPLLLHNLNQIGVGERERERPERGKGEEYLLQLCELEPEAMATA